MPPKIAKKGTNSQTKQAIADTQAEPHDQASQPDGESQIDAETQVDADVPSSSVNSDVVNDTLASTADGADPSTADTTHTSAADEAENNKPAGKRPAGKKVPASADVNKDGEGKKKRRRKKDFTNFSAYIFKVLKQVHPDNGISTKAMMIMNDFVKDLFARIAELACDLCKKLKKATLQAHEIQTATKLILPGALAKHAQSEGAKALHTFNKATQKGLR